MKQHRLCRRLVRLMGPQEEMGQKHLADCSSMGLAVSVYVFSHCVSVYESIPVSVCVFRCVWSAAGTCINPVTIPYLDICSCYHGWLHCRYRITSLNTKNTSSVCRRKINVYLCISQCQPKSGILLVEILFRFLQGLNNFLPHLSE